MISRYNVWLNDVALSEINPDIYVANIAYQPISVVINAVDHAGQYGQYSGKTRMIKNNRIVVSFMVRTYETNARQAIVQDIIAWAGKGGWLKCSDRAGQKIYVKPSKFPAITSVMAWADTLTIEFTAYDFPFWQDEVPNIVELNSGDEGDIFVPGVQKTMVEAIITPSETMTEFSIECGETRFGINDISILANQLITISYTDEHHILEIKSGGTSLLSKRTADSDDDLMLEPGTNYLYFDSATSAVCRIMVKGVYV